MHEGCAGRCAKPFAAQNAPAQGTNIFRVLVKTLLRASSPTGRSTSAAWVDVEGLRRGRGVVGDAIAAEEYLRAITPQRRVMARKSPSRFPGLDKCGASGRHDKMTEQFADLAVAARKGGLFQRAILVLGAALPVPRARHRPARAGRGDSASIRWRRRRRARKAERIGVIGRGGDLPSPPGLAAPLQPTRLREMLRTANISSVPILCRVSAERRARARSGAALKRPSPRPRRVPRGPVEGFSAGRGAVHDADKRNLPIAPCCNTSASSWGVRVMCRRTLCSWRRRCNPCELTRRIVDARDNAAGSARRSARRTAPCRSRRRRATS